VRDRLDDFLGDRVDRVIRSHHRRRLGRIGWEHALDAPPGPWASGDPPPRSGNELAPLVDGAAALPAIARAIEAARSYVHLAGWYFSPSFQLEDRG
jgi:phosphatidylserine/phosphatidylglycerophosphate/cardiolipin synthase-like enzyme